MTTRERKSTQAQLSARPGTGSDFAPTRLLGALFDKWKAYWHSPQPKKDLVFFSTFLAVAFVINATVIGNVYVPTGSMRDTIREDERFFVWKLGYGIQNLFSPRHKFRIDGKPILRWSEVGRGDIVVFVPPEQTGVDEKYVKRLIALPGDTVEVRPGVGVFINDRHVAEPYLREAPRYWLPPQVVPEGKVFVLGDNRNNSYDSHAWGFLDQESIQGVMAFRYWPLPRAGFLGRNAARNNRILLVVIGCLAVGHVGLRWVRRQREEA
jgi:signal peptidase I